MKKLSFLTLLLLFSNGLLFAQIGINTDNSQPDPSAMLDVKSTTTGALIPRMTQTQIILISNPANGLVVFCTTDNKFYAYLSGVNTWKEILYGSGTFAPFTCGVSLTINHVAGTVAPVTKTVTYGTVTNIPGETSKCWITSNLGADHQATSVSDATEASAGWYWQFNRKQGFKHDGTTRTPNTTWITSISENSDWISSNDPCTIEIGSGWRIPTYTEWNNLMTSGGWTNWNGPWGSGLKLHAAGELVYYDGSLTNQGVWGTYWSSTQYDATTGGTLMFHRTDCYTENAFKVFGYTLRCVRDN
jgi:hypothetical protein